MDPKAIYDLMELMAEAEEQHFFMSIGVGMIPDEKILEKKPCTRCENGVSYTWEIWVVESCFHCMSMSYIDPDGILMHYPLEVKDDGVHIIVPDRNNTLSRNMTKLHEVFIEDEVERILLGTQHDL